jgi:hypothetical protein
MKLFLYLLIIGLLFGCKSEEVTPLQPVRQKVYQIMPAPGMTTSGTATFQENVDGSLTILLELINTVEGTEHPAHLHYNTMAERGVTPPNHQHNGSDKAIMLQNVDGTTGISRTTFTTLTDGTPINYAVLINIDAHILVHRSVADHHTVLAGADVGQNVLTGRSERYLATTVTADNIKGEVTLQERENGETLISFALENTFLGNQHPAVLHAPDGTELLTLAPIDGNYGTGSSNIAFVQGDDKVTFEDLLTQPYYISIKRSALEPETEVARVVLGIEG